MDMNYENIKKCCILSCGELYEEEEIEKKLFAFFNGVIKKGITCFLFGEKTPFSMLCHEILSYLRWAKYPFLSRYVYLMKGECAFTEKDRENFLTYNYYDLKEERTFYGFEKTVYKSSVSGEYFRNKLERSENLVDDSAYCLTYYYQICKFGKERITEEEKIYKTAECYAYSGGKHVCDFSEKKI